MEIVHLDQIFALDTRSSIYSSVTGNPAETHCDSSLYQ